MTFPTQLTVARIGLAVLVVTLLFLPGWLASVAALVVFLVASATDWLDGYLARRWRQTSSLGALLDPIADKILVLGVVIALVPLRLVPAWMASLICLRELAVTGVRLRLASRDEVLPAARDGKYKTVAQMLAIVLILAVRVVEALAGPGHLPRAFAAVTDWVLQGCLWAATALTVTSGVTFFLRHRMLLRGLTGR